MKNIVVLILIVFFIQCLFGCATKAGKIGLVKERAVFDLDCPSISVVELGNNVFGVTGCGKRNTYVLQHSSDGSMLSHWTAIMNSDVKEKE